MKSAYELAMERLQKSDPDAVTELTDSQKEELAEIETAYKAKIAEREVFLQGTLREAEAKGDSASAMQIRQQLTSERERLEIERDEKKEQVRNRR